MTTRDILTAYFDAFNADDSAGMHALLSEDVAHHVNQGGIRKGLDQFKAFSAHMDRCYKERLTDLVLMVSEDGTRGAAEFIVNGEYLATDEGLPEANGQTYRLPAGSFFEIENEKITRVTTYYNLQDWIAQVGG
ncbi:ketosteroid isomerase-related protein [Paracoccaceae bacterium GXU_MW_L88]